MKHGKHSKSRNNVTTKNTRNVSARKERNDSDIILSHTPKGRKVFDLITKIFFAVELCLVIALIIYATVVDFFPVQYIFAGIVLLGILAGVHMRLLTGKVRRKHFKRKRIISFCLSLAVFIGSIFGMSYMGLIDNMIGDIAIDGNEVENEDQVDNIAKHPFVVYLSGVDTRNSDEIKEKALSDVNMIIAVNPQQKRVLMVSTPRDYYVALEGNVNRMDKLTHAGNKGVECSMKTLEALYGIEFNYYARVNFKSVYDIVNALDGVTVISDYNFSSSYSYTEKRYTFKKGENHLTGDSALAFARERKAFADGDRQRGIHQQKVIEAVVKKAISPAILIPSNIDSMLKAISNNTKTNFSASEIKKLINYQMGSMGKSWDFESMSVDGKGGYATTYSYPNQSLYVMRPDMETVNEATAAIKAIIAGEPLPSEQTESDVSDVAASNNKKSK